MADIQPQRQGNGRGNHQGQAAVEQVLGQPGRNACRSGPVGRIQNHSAVCSKRFIRAPPPVQHRAAVPGRCDSVPPRHRRLPTRYRARPGRGFGSVRSSAPAQPRREYSFQHHQQQIHQRRQHQGHENSDHDFGHEVAQQSVGEQETKVRDADRRAHAGHRYVAHRRHPQASHQHRNAQRQIHLEEAAHRPVAHGRCGLPDPVVHGLQRVNHRTDQQRDCINGQRNDQVGHFQDSGAQDHRQDDEQGQRGDGVQHRGQRQDEAADGVDPPGQIAAAATPPARAPAEARTGTSGAKSAPAHTAGSPGTTPSVAVRPEPLQHGGRFDQAGHTTVGVDGNPRPGGRGQCRVQRLPEAGAEREQRSPISAFAGSR